MTYVNKQSAKLAYLFTCLIFLWSEQKLLQINHRFLRRQQSNEWLHFTFLNHRVYLLYSASIL